MEIALLSEKIITETIKDGEVELKETFKSDIKSIETMPTGKIPVVKIILKTGGIFCFSTTIVSNRPDWSDKNKAIADLNEWLND